MLRSVLTELALICAALSQTYPSSMLIPSNAMSHVVMVCMGFPPVRWRVNGTDSDIYPPVGIVVSTTNLEGNIARTLTILSAYVLSYNGSSFQCSINGENFNNVPTAFLVVFGIIYFHYF